MALAEAASGTTLAAARGERNSTETNSKCLAGRRTSSRNGRPRTNSLPFKNGSSRLAPTYCWLVNTDRRERRRKVGHFSASALTKEDIWLLRGLPLLSIGSHFRPAARCALWWPAVVVEIRPYLSGASSSPAHALLSGIYCWRAKDLLLIISGTPGCRAVPIDRYWMAKLGIAIFSLLTSSSSPSTSSQKQPAAATPLICIFMMEVEEETLPGERG